MNRIRCFILDGQINSIDRLREMLYLTHQVNIIGESCDPNNAIDLILDLRPELMFINVELPYVSGFDVVKEIRNNLFFPKFVFVTEFSHYAIKAIRADIFDYIIKPIDLDELKKSLHRLRDTQKKLHLPQGCYLTNRENEVLKLIAEGKTSKEIGKQLHLSKHTIDTHRRKIIGKLKVNSISDFLIRNKYQLTIGLHSEIK